MHGNSKFKCCWEVFKLIFIPSHGQASLERGFFVNKELLISQEIVNNHICDLSVTDVPFSSDLLKSCKLSHSRYTSALELKKSDEIENEKSRKRRIQMDEVADVKEKKSTVESCIESMEISIEKFSFEAEKEGKWSLLIVKLSMERRELRALWMRP